jgi:predicted porin
LGRFNAAKDLDLSKTDGSTKTSKTGWGATYDFSKRTKAVFAASVTEKGSANLNAGSLLTGRNQYIGLAHNF